MIEKLIAAFVLFLGVYALYSRRTSFAFAAELCLVFLVSLTLLFKALPQAIAVFVLGVTIVLVYYRSKLQRRVSSATPSEKYLWPKVFFRLIGVLFFLTVIQLARNGETSIGIAVISQTEAYSIFIGLFLAAMYFKRKPNWKS